MRSAALLAAVLIAASLQGANAAEAPKAAAAPVVTSEVKSGSVKPYETYVGALKYATLSKLAAESSAPLEFVKADAGDRVKAGQVLARQESAILSANIAAKSAELQKSRSSEAQAKKDAERYKKLLAQNSVSEQTYEQFRLKAEQETAQSEGLKAQLEAMEIERRKRTIVAPFDGIVVERFASVGDYLSTGKEIVSLAKADSIEMIAYLPAATIDRAGAGTKAIVSVLGAEYPAKIVGVSPKGDAGSRTFLTRVAFDKPSAKLLEGMEATLKIEGQKSENALLVDRDAVINRFGSPSVFFVQNGVAKIAGVEVLGYDGQFAAVRSAVLKAGMQAIVKGNERIMPDQAVKAQ